MALPGFYYQSDVLLQAGPGEGCFVRGSTSRYFFPPPLVLNAEFALAALCYAISELGCFPAPGVCDQIAKMEQAIKKALLQRGTLYRDISSPLLGQLEAIAGQHGLDSKGIASAFDRFMTTSRWMPSQVAMSCQPALMFVRLTTSR